MRDYASTLPVLLDSDLRRAGWNGTINSYPGIPLKQVLCQSIRKSLLKKYQDNISASAEENALALFCKVNAACAEWSLKTSSMDLFDEIAVNEMKHFIAQFFVSEGYSILSPGSIADGFGVGSGANIGSYSTDFISKMGTSTMAATDRALYSYFVQAIGHDSIWSDVESVRLERRGVSIVQGSRLSFVPKTAEICRTICTEPLLNMIFQKGIESVLLKQLKKVIGIDLSKQQKKNRVLARLGSETGKFGTIDLSSASDSMSNGLVSMFFPRQVLYWLELTRCKETILPDGSRLDLHMVSSMGNAFTFPLQTLFFFSIVYAVYRLMDIRLEYPFGDRLGNFAVNGDDIIVDNRAYDRVCRLLRLCGFSVNVDKSFNEGFFRESCGHDYYHGYNVRGVYIKTLKNVYDQYSAINRLNVWSAEHGILLPETIQFLLKGCRFLRIPLDESDVSGIKVPMRSLKVRKIDKYTGGIMYHYVHLRPLDFDVSNEKSCKPRIRGWINNPSAILLAALAGYLRRGKVALRVDRPLTTIRRRYSSRWDYIPPELGVSQAFVERWKSFYEVNLNLL